MQHGRSPVVEIPGGLVENQKVGIVHEGEDDRKVSPIVPAVLTVATTQVEVEALGKLAHTVLVHAPPQARQVRDDLAAPHRAKLRRLIGHIADASLDLGSIAEAIEPEDIGGSTSGAEHAHEEANRGGLAGAFKTQQTECLARGNLELDVKHAMAAAVVLGKAGRSE